MEFNKADLDTGGRHARLERTQDLGLPDDGEDFLGGKRRDDAQAHGVEAAGRCRVNQVERCRVDDSEVIERQGRHVYAASLGLRSIFSRLSR